MSSKTEFDLNFSSTCAKMRFRILMKNGQSMCFFGLLPIDVSTICFDIIEMKKYWYALNNNCQMKCFQV